MYIYTGCLTAFYTLKISSVLRKIIKVGFFLYDSQGLRLKRVFDSLYINIDGTLKKKNVFSFMSLKKKTEFVYP